MERKQQFFCKVITAAATDPVRTITFRDEWARPRELLPRRVGRPKHRWALKENQRMWARIQEGSYQRVAYNPNSVEQGQGIVELATRIKKK